MLGRKPREKLRDAPAAGGSPTHYREHHQIFSSNSPEW